MALLAMASSAGGRVLITKLGIRGKERVETHNPNASLTLVVWCCGLSSGRTNIIIDMQVIELLTMNQCA